MAKDVTLLIKLQDQVSGKVRAIAGASKKAQAAIQKLQRAVEGVGRKFDRLKSKASAGLNAIAAKAKNAAKSFGGFGKAAAIAAAAAGALAGLRFAFTQAGELEKATRSLKVLTGSLDDAKRIISELQAFGAVTPFTSAELIDTAKRLKAFGFETEKIVDVTKRLADVAGATGADLGGIATAFGQIQAKGRLQGEELLQLQERGINLQDELQKMYGMTGDEFRKALEKGRFSADAVNLALVKLTSTGGKYAEGAIAQSDTLFGKLSTLQDAFIRLGQNIGKALAPIFKFLIDQTTRLVNAINGIFARNAAINAVRQRQQEKGMSGRTLGRFMGSEEGRAAVEAELARRRAAANTTTGTGLPDPNAKPPELLGGTGGVGGAGKERVDISEKLLALNKELFDSDTQLTELQKLGLEFQIEKQEILDRNLLPREEEVALLKAAAGFEQDLIGYREEQIRLQQDAIKKSTDAFDAQLKQQEDLRQAQLEADPGYQMKQRLEELLNVQNQVAAGATAIANAFTNSFKSIITGSKSAEQALGDMLAAVAEHFMEMAAKIIAQQLAMILFQSILNALGGPRLGGGAGPGGYRIPKAAAPKANIPRTGYAEGGFVTGPTNALIGEGGEPEYVIPQSKMKESMARFSAGARGSSVIPANGGGGGDYGGAMGGGTVVNYNGPTLNFNSEDYVPASAVPGIIDEAAKRGAKAGETRTFASLQNSRSRRSRIGLGS